MRARIHVEAKPQEKVQTDFIFYLVGFLCGYLKLSTASSFMNDDNLDNTSRAPLQWSNYSSVPVAQVPCKNSPTLVSIHPCACILDNPKGNSAQVCVGTIEVCPSEKLRVTQLSLPIFHRDTLCFMTFG